MGLLNKLDSAKVQLIKGNTVAACNKLRGFIEQVQDFIDDATLTSGQGQPLVNAAEAIRSEIVC